MAVGPQIVEGDNGKYSAYKEIDFAFNTTLTTLSNAADSDIIGGVITGYRVSAGAADQIPMIGDISATGTILITLGAASTASCTYTVQVVRGSWND